MWATPLDPGQALAAGAQRRRGVEISTLGQDLTVAVCEGNSDKPVNDGLVLMGFFHRHDEVGCIVQITIAAFTLGQCHRLAAIEWLTVKLLIRVVDEDGL